MASNIIPTYFTAVDKFSGPVRAMAAHMGEFAERAEGTLGRGERAFRKLTPALGEASKQLLEFASLAAIMGGVLFTIKSVSDYERALASLSAITGVTGDAFDKFKVQVMAVAKETERSAVEVAKAFEIVGSQQPELLKNADALGEVTKAAIILARAGDMELADAGKAMTGVMNQFSLGAEDAARVMNVLGAGAVAGGARIAEINESMTGFGIVAKTANMSVEQAVAAVETLGRYSIKGADAGTMLKTVIMRLQKAGLGYKSGLFDINDALAEAKAKMDKMHTAKQKDMYLMDLLERRGIVGGKILMNNTELMAQFTKAVTGTNKANEMAETKSQTLGIALEELKNKWINMVIGSDGATSALSRVREAVKWVTHHLEGIVSVGLRVITFFAAWKALLIAGRIAMVAYNIVYGINNALQQKSLFYTEGNIVAKYADLAVTKLMTAAQWAWNVAMDANPIGLVILLVAALVAVIYELATAVDGWGEQWDSIVSAMGYDLKAMGYEIKFWALTIEDAFLTMIDTITLAWFGMEKSMGMISDQQFAKIASNIKGEQALRKLSIAENKALFQLNAMRGGQEAEWKLKWAGGDETDGEPTEKGWNPNKPAIDLSHQRNMDQIHRLQHEITTKNKTEITVRALPGTQVGSSDGNVSVVPVVGSTMSFHGAGGSW